MNTFQPHVALLQLADQVLSACPRCGSACIGTETLPVADGMLYARHAHFACGSWIGIRPCLELADAYNLCAPGKAGVA